MINLVWQATLHLFVRHSNCKVRLVDQFLYLLSHMDFSFELFDLMNKSGSHHIEISWVVWLHVIWLGNHCLSILALLGTNYVHIDILCESFSVKLRFQGLRRFFLCHYFVHIHLYRFRVLIVDELLDLGRLWISAVWAIATSPWNKRSRAIT